MLFLYNHSCKRNQDKCIAKFEKTMIHLLTLPSFSKFCTSFISSTDISCVVNVWSHNWLRLVLF